MSSVHLLVLVHGMWGNPIHLSELNRIIRATKTTNDEGISLQVLLAQTNSDDSTYDGIDWGGERVAQEVADEVAKLEDDGKKVVKFSITGYSLGGLISRYVVGILRQKGFFDKVTPVNFNTIATPHIGLLRYPSLVSSLFSTLGPKLLSRTGEQFYCVDQWSKTGRPLLEVMADPEQIFYQGLALFQHIRIYANAVHDRTVPYLTSAIEIEDPFAEREVNGIEIEIDETYPHIIKSYSLPDVPPPPTPKPVVLSRPWFRQLKTGKPILPPFLQFRFPLNIVFYTMLPLLIPIGISLALIRLSLASRSSRARIKILEKDETNSQKLIHILSQLEKDVEDAVVDIIDDPGQSLDGEELSVAPGTAANSKSRWRKKDKAPTEHPVITPVQRKIADSLNKLPIKKEIAYFPSVQNAHAVIISRDVKRFEFHRMGEGVIQHWADTFIL